MANKPPVMKKIGPGSRARQASEARQKRARNQYRFRLLECIADNQHKGVDWKQVQKKVEAGIKDPDGPAVARTLGRLISSGRVCSNLTINGNPPTASRDASSVKMHRGYVAISVNISRMRDASWQKESPEGQPNRLYPEEKSITSQWDLVKLIAQNTATWSPERERTEAPRAATTAQEGPNQPNVPGTTAQAKPGQINNPPRWPRSIVIVDFAVLHASTWDILITVLYENPQHFMKYVREVVQMAPHVTGTQTIFVSE
jgi:hypothetical protein